jgi:hypothetical protein
VCRARRVVFVGCSSFAGRDLYRFRVTGERWLLRHCVAMK